MKLYVVLVLLFVGVAMAQEEILEEGQPGCTTDREMEQKNIRNKSDPTMYWVCEERGKPATLVQCPEGTIFLNSRRECVNPGLLTGGRPLPLPDLPLPNLSISDILGNRN